MRRPLVPGLLLALAVLALLVAALLPPRAVSVPPAGWTPTHPTVRGAYHVHSRRSDGTGTLDEIAAAAASAGLDFVILTDHGDGTRAPEPPRYRSGVLVIDGVEISTSGGHYVALDLPQSPYRLAGTPESVVEDVARLGGFGFAAHPDSAKPELRWTAWDAPIDGIEWLNADSEWRDELWSSRGRGLLTYFFRPAETLATFLGRPAQTLARWDALGRARRIVGIAGADAHARLGFRPGADPYDDQVVAPVPGYIASFRTFQNHVILDEPLRDDAAADARQILTAVREGRVYTTIDGLASGGALEVTATSGDARASVGGELDIRGPVTITARLAAPPGTSMVVWRDERLLAEFPNGSFRLEAGVTPGVYRVEARLPGRDAQTSVPWLVANPIYVGLRARHREAGAAAHRLLEPAQERPLDFARSRPEVSEGSASTADVQTGAEDGPSLLWRFSLGPPGPPPPYAALQFPIDGGLGDADRVRVLARASRPMRVWVQLRVPHTGERWGRTFYVDEGERDVTLPLDSFRPFEAGQRELPKSEVDSLLLVVDTLNTAPGAEGALRVRTLALGAPPAR